MFGRDWEPGTATIVAKKFKESGDRSGVWEYVADVTVGSGPVFRTTLKQPALMSHVVWLQEGERVPVLADVKRQKAKFDRSDPRVNGKARRAQQDAFDQALAGAPGTPPPHAAADGDPS